MCDLGNVACLQSQEARECAPGVPGQRRGNLVGGDTIGRKNSSYPAGRALTSEPAVNGRSAARRVARRPPRPAELKICTTVEVTLEIVGAGILLFALLDRLPTLSGRESCISSPTDRPRRPRTFG